MSAVLDELDSQFTGLRGDDEIVAGMMMCARKLPYFVCTDPMLFGLISPGGAGVVGMGMGVVETAQRLSAP